MDEVSKKSRGRPRLSDEERKKRRAESKKRYSQSINYEDSKQYHKEHGYESQKKWKAKKESICISVPVGRKETIVNLAKEKGMTVSELIIEALVGHYHIDL